LAAPQIEKTTVIQYRLQIDADDMQILLGILREGLKERWLDSFEEKWAEDFLRLAQMALR
jgi:hypothetical protein